MGVAPDCAAPGGSCSAGLLLSLGGTASAGSARNSGGASHRHSSSAQELQAAWHDGYRIRSRSGKPATRALKFSSPSGLGSRSNGCIGKSVGPVAAKVRRQAGL